MSKTSKKLRKEANPNTTPNRRRYLGLAAAAVIGIGAAAGLAHILTQKPEKQATQESYEEHQKVTQGNGYRLIIVNRKYQNKPPMLVRIDIGLEDWLREDITRKGTLYDEVYGIKQRQTFIANNQISRHFEVPLDGRTVVYVLGRTLPNGETQEIHRATLQPEQK